MAPQQSLNVFKQPLKLFSQQPMTGFYRDGYCRTSPQDPGNHAVAGIVTDEFLDFSASRGNDLRSVGLKGGCRWCLCTARWFEAVKAHQAGKVSNMGVPRVDLEATEDSALSMVNMETFRKFAAQGGGQPGGSGGSGSGAA
ncbi:Uu.00g145420.m01.CDS01 [Anthostomella pinea]|uniref:Uu.00g145420.m01.CDS01 n=1 Tax=Anthostomella pinea TaxID=933095 RepID=A0AAI8VR46_9PEZI|nr:Uu.00g145420.m01.CDS01 [Anthostomella pinea]